MVTGVLWKYASAGLAVLCVVLFILWKAEARHADKLEDRVAYYRSELARVIDGQREAQRMNKAEVARIKQEQEGVTREVETNLTHRLERLRRELREQAANRDPNRPGTSPDGKAPGGTPEAPGVCLAPEQHVRAAENEERHDQLIDWVEKLLQIKR